MTEKELDIIKISGNNIQTKGVSNEFLVQLIELSLDFLNANIIFVYAKKIDETTMVPRNLKT